MSETGRAQEPEDIPGVPLIAQRAYCKEQGLFGGNFLHDDRAVDPYLIEVQERRKQHNDMYKKIIRAEGIEEMPDMRRGINSSLLNRCKERIARAMQRKAKEQIDDKPNRAG
jgi:hypothetical protein